MIRGGLSGIHETAPEREKVVTTGSPDAVNLHYYDAKGRPALELAQTDGKWFYTESYYDLFSRISEEVNPTSQP